MHRDVHACPARGSADVVVEEEVEEEEVVEVVVVEVRVRVRPEGSLREGSCMPSLGLTKVQVEVYVPHRNSTLPVSDPVPRLSPRTAPCT